MKSSGIGMSENQEFCVGVSLYKRQKEATQGELNYRAIILKVVAGSESEAEGVLASIFAESNYSANKWDSWEKRPQGRPACITYASNKTGWQAVPADEQVQEEKFIGFTKGGAFPRIHWVIPVGKAS